MGETDYESHQNNPIGQFCSAIITAGWAVAFGILYRGNLDPDPLTHETVSGLGSAYTEISKTCTTRALPLAVGHMK